MKQLYIFCMLSIYLQDGVVGGTYHRATHNTLKFHNSDDLLESTCQVCIAKSLFNNIAIMFITCQMLPYPLVSSKVLLILYCCNHVLVFFRWNSPSGPCGMMMVKCCKRSFFFLFYLVKLLLYHMMMFASSCSSHVLLQNVYIREYLLDLLCEHLVDVIYYLNFI